MPTDYSFAVVSRSLWLEGIVERKPLDPFKVTGVARDQGEAVNQCRRCRQSITKCHLSLLAQSHCFMEHCIRDWKNCGGSEECFEMLALLVADPRISKNLNEAHRRNHWRIFCDKFSEHRVLRPGRIDDDVAINQCHESLPGNGRSWRCWRSQAAGSVMSVAAFNLASSASASAIRCP